MQIFIFLAVVIFLAISFSGVYALVDIVIELRKLNNKK